MNNKNLLKNINFVLNKLGFAKKVSKSGNFEIWTLPENSSLILAIPQDPNHPNFPYYEDILIDSLIKILKLKPDVMLVEDLKSQLVDLNYKLINKISFRSEFNSLNQTVPLELAQTITNKNISAFRTYFHQQTKGIKKIPIENFKLNHTIKGSFVIPVSIVYDFEQNLFEEIPNELNQIIRSYLEKVDTLRSIDRSSKDSFVETVREREIYSKVIRDFLDEKDSISAVTKKYQSQIDDVMISSSFNPLLDMKLKKQDKIFPTVKIADIEPVENEYLLYLEEVEINEDNLQIHETGTQIIAEVDGIHKNGTARFTIYNVGNLPIEKPFKAMTVKLSNDRINFCADALKYRNKITIEGDITKQKGKVGEIIVDNLESPDIPMQQNLFEGSSDKT